MGNMQIPGWRPTKIRTAMLSILSRAKKPLSVQEILSKLRDEHIVANKTTIYRDLTIFLKEKVIASVGFGDDKKRYELTARGHHHHLICKNCARVEDVVLKGELTNEERRIEKNKNFKILHHSLEFYGICNNCQIA